MKTKHTVGPFEYEIEQIPEGVDPHEFLQHAMDNCPDCQAARARGEKPVIQYGAPPMPEISDELRAIIEAPDEPESRQARRARERRLAKRRR